MKHIPAGLALLALIVVVVFGALYGLRPEHGGTGQPTAVDLLNPPADTRLVLRKLQTLTKKDLFDWSTGEKQPVHTILPSDLEFFPDGSGQALLTSSTGTIVWLDADMQVLGQFQVASANSLANQRATGETWDNEGLLGLAFDPDFASNGFFYVQLNEKPGQGLYVWRLVWQPDDLDAIWASRELIFHTAKTQVATSPAHLHNHNGGNPAFGADGLLYLFIGDGGIGGFDFDDNESQDLQSYWGKVLRLDPHGDRQPEILARGLRNPFTHAWFDGGLIMGDVGFDNPQDWEEVNLLPLDPAKTSAPVNFGWPFFSGPCPPDHAGDCAAFIDPLLGYAKADSSRIAEDPDGVTPPPGTANRSSVIVGPVYQGTRYGGYLDNVLLYTDLLQGWIRGALLSDAGAVLADRHLLHHRDKFITGFTVGPDDYVYMTSGYGGAVSIHRLEMTSEPEVVQLPQTLSASQLFYNLEEATPNHRAIAFQPAYPIWKNGTAGTRFLLLPPDAKIDTADPDHWRFPTDTRLVRHLALPTEDSDDGAPAQQPVETQLLLNTGDGWIAGAYLWNDRGRDAELVRGRPVSKPLDSDGAPRGATYTVLTGPQCFTCHTDAENTVIGLSAAQLDQAQLDALFARGALTHRVQSATYSVSDDPAAQARAYLHGNCALCHSNRSLGQMLGFSLVYDEIDSLAAKRSIRSQRALVTPGDADASQLYNMLARRPGHAPMPPLGRDFADPEGLAIVRAWIEGPLANAAEWAVDTATTAPLLPADGGGPATIDLAGVVRSDTGKPVCAVVVVGRDVTLSCDAQGSFAFDAVPLGADGVVRRQIYARKFYPRTDTLFESSDAAIVLQRLGSCPDGSVEIQPAEQPAADSIAAGDDVTLRGRVLLEDGQPLADAVVLANGRHTFTAKDSGEFNLTLPLNAKGQARLFVFSPDTVPLVHTLDAATVAAGAPLTARVVPLSECR